MTQYLSLLHRDSVRSVWGQLVLLGLTYTGAGALAVVALCVRGYFFEYHARERYPETSPSIRAMIDQGAHATGAADELGPLGAAERDATYGAWISEPESDPKGRAALRLLWSNPDELIRKLRITCVVGNFQQRLRALELLSYAKEEYRNESVALCRYLAERGRRRGEWALVDKADDVLRRL
jgi:hypothetical protein